MSVINHIRSKYLLRNEKCSIAKAIEVLAVHYANGNEIVDKGIDTGIKPFYFTDEQMTYYIDTTSRILKDPMNYNNMRFYDTLEREIRKVMYDRNELEEEIKLINTMDRTKGIEIINEYIIKLVEEYNNYKENKNDSKTEKEKEKPTKEI